MCKLTIALPTFNRAQRLRKSLHYLSLTSSDTINSDLVDFCIVDNASTDATADVVRAASDSLHIRYVRNDHNIGLCNNILKCMTIGNGEFTWIVGDDDIILPGTIARVLDEISKKPAIDFIGLPLGLIDDERLDLGLESEDVSGQIERFVVPESSALWKFVSRFEATQYRTRWENLIDPDFNSVFLGALMVSVFRTDRVSLIAGKSTIEAGRLPFDDLLNSYPHSAVFARCFVGRPAVILSQLAVAAIRWDREWNDYRPLLVTRRLNDLLDLYARQGVPRLKVRRCRQALFSHYPENFWEIVFERNKEYRQDFSLLRQFWKYLGYREFWRGVLRPVSQTAVRLLRKIMSVPGGVFVARH